MRIFVVEKLIVGAGGAGGTGSSFILERIAADKSALVILHKTNCVGEPS